MSIGGHPKYDALPFVCINSTPNLRFISSTNSAL
nr:MAG TPA: hypothetical protein [Caudoviricetes sp.]